MKSPRPFILLLLFLTGGPLVPPTGAQETFPGASPAFPSLATAPGARPVAMGESFTAIADDSSALFFNPAGLAWLSQGELSAMHVNHLGASLYETAAFVTPFSPKIGFGLHFGFLNYGTFDRRNDLGTVIGSYTARDLSAGTGVGFEVSRSLAVGLHTEWISQTIDRTKVNGLWWDIGFLAHPVRSFRIGLDLKNMGVAENGGAAPFEAHWAAAWRWTEAKTANALWLSAGAALVPHGNDRVHLGAEIDHQHKLFFRAGWAPVLENNGLSPIQGLSFGLGFRILQLQGDYAFTLQDKLGEIHRFTISYLFPGKEATDSTARFVPPDPRKNPRPIEAGPPSGKPNNQPVNGGSNAVAADSTPGPGVLGTPAPVTLTREATPGKGDESVVEIRFKVEDIELLDAPQCLTRARKLEKQGQHREALKFCLAAVEKDPQLEAAWIELGQLQIRMGLGAFDEALKLNPNNEALRRWLKNQRSH